MGVPPDVVLLRSADAEAPDRYRAACREAGLRAVCKPVLAFAFPQQAQLRTHLESADRHAALLVTSPRAVTALARVFSDHAPLAQRWAGRRAYTVGPKTAERLRSIGLRPRGADTGTAEALAARITNEAPDASLLFLSGNRRRDTLPEALRAAAVPFEEAVVYETHIRADLGLPAPKQEAWLVFFSPSGLDAVRQAADADVQDYRLAAIGPTTAEALEAEGHVVEAVADTPSPNGLVAALRAAAGPPS
ncbi:uroporphyrinogen-III synthase [Salinibacter altiplanensis]|uniref:uroporphyrinogen-III synthase n=1 Tax=Salinibacter altiplanensis TaxID=1803181 RepID=UPI000C9F2FB0|nr:uroporphyrinogen-III synthase [Salinibacter altiplanensis]